MTINVRNILIVLGMILPINASAEQIIDKKPLKESINQSKEQKDASAYCKEVMHSFMNERSYLSKPILINTSKFESSYYCLIQYTKDNVNYSSPINIQITYNPKTGSYKYKPM